MSKRIADISRAEVQDVVKSGKVAGRSLSSRWQDFSVNGPSPAKTMLSNELLTRSRSEGEIYERLNGTLNLFMSPSYG
jgi:hypothetical protein